MGSNPGPGFKSHTKCRIFLLTDEQTPLRCTCNLYIARIKNGDGKVLPSKGGINDSLRCDLGRVLEGVPKI